ncbi:MAG: polysaccharide deacetylase family protein [Gemmatimonadota bacterium]|nr:polysaccharide deacetylase family protein [Gemmatimonadota bacterium]
MHYLAQSWRFVSPVQFAAMIAGEERIRGKNLLLTFDDGFASNRVVAETVLNPMGIRALFFVVSDFVQLTDHVEARRFIARHIHPGTCVDGVAAHLYNMGWSDLEALLEQGHSIGGHTRTHARLSDVRDEGDLELEVAGSADTLADRLGIRVDHFAFTFGNLASFSKPAMDTAMRRFRFVYSGLRGDNVSAVSPYAIRRDSVTAQVPEAVLEAFVEGAADLLYAASRARLANWARKANEASR